jgi:hypothetical protein
MIRQKDGIIFKKSTVSRTNGTHKTKKIAAHNKIHHAVVSLGLSNKHL